MPSDPWQITLMRIAAKNGHAKRGFPSLMIQSFSSLTFQDEVCPAQRLLMQLAAFVES
jgi:hypothetical protein